MDRGSFRFHLPNSPIVIRLKYFAKNEKCDHTRESWLGQPSTRLLVSFKCRSLMNYRRRLDDSIAPPGRLRPPARPPVRPSTRPSVHPSGGSTAPVTRRHNCYQFARRNSFSAGVFIAFIFRSVRAGQMFDYFRLPPTAGATIAHKRPAHVSVERLTLFIQYIPVSYNIPIF